MCDSLPHETYRPNAEFDPDAYSRSVYSFWCPVCDAGRQQPDIKLNLAHSYGEWIYRCDHCEAGGTKKQIENSAFYAARIPPRTCPICGDRIMPYAQRMQGDWWMQPSRTWAWRCQGCTYIGDFRDFADEANRQLVTFESVA
jgi:hypothetical protein